MACRRKAGSVETLVHGVISCLSPLDIEAATGKTTDLFYKVSNPNHQQQLAFKDAIRLDSKLCEIGRDAVFFRHYQIALAGRAGHPGSPSVRLIALMKELGEAADAVQGPADKNRMLKEVYDVMDAAQDLINAIEGGPND